VSDEAFFDAFRAWKREETGDPTAVLSQAEVNAANAIKASWPKSAIHENPTALSDGAAFFENVRSSFGALTQEQVDGIQRLLQAYGVAKWPIAYAAYGLATAWRETNKQMQPVEEAYYLGTKADGIPQEAALLSVVRPWRLPMYVGAPTIARLTSRSASVGRSSQTRT
jgi:hypothetical protein